MKPESRGPDDDTETDEPSWLEKLIILIGLASFFIFLILLMKLAMLAHQIEAGRYLEEG